MIGPRITNSLFESVPDYGTAPFDIRNFSKNETLFSKNDEERIAVLMKKRIISGRFAQEGDKTQSLLERYFVEIPYQSA